MVSNQQGAFIKGRNIQEQVALASEMTNEIDIKRRGGNFGLKLDIIQAYDSLSWKFLFQALGKFGLSDQGIHWLQVLLQYASISILVNGGPEGYFQVGRGLRKGDPLSLLLFVISEDILSSNISKMIHDGNLKAMVNRGGVQPSHIFFADDIFLFCNGERRNVSKLMGLLNKYQATSRQQINLEKSKCFIDGTSQSRRTQISEDCHVFLAEFPDKYLGVMLMQSNVKAQHVWSVVDMMQEKLAGWKGLRWIIGEMKENTRWIVGDGNSISTWSDKWALDIPLQEAFPENAYILQFPKMKVSDFLLDARNKILAVKEICLSAFITVKELWFLINECNFGNGKCDLNVTKKKIKQVMLDNDLRLTAIIWNTQYDLQIIKYFGLKTRKVKSMRTQEIYFKLPEQDKLLLCCDGAFRANPGNAGYGIVGRLSSGEFVVAISGGLGVSTNYYAEVFAVLMAVEWAMNKGFNKLVFRTDSKAAINAFQNNTIPWFAATRWERICEAAISWEFIHSYREINFSADNMAKKDFVGVEMYSRGFCSMESSSCSWDLPKDFIDNGISFEFDKYKGTLIEVERYFHQSHVSYSDIWEKIPNKVVIDTQQLVGTMKCLDVVRAELKKVNCNLDLMKKHVKEPPKKDVPSKFTEVVVSHKLVNQETHAPPEPFV
ncbi:uncharacterized protein LOC113336778 [Papaver somniferum]|uniref:uncharacterized protein LOC113336778 n=1 Tax=Papaver somniferum TaxID=3469 RepID=UPI000E6F7E15|nr:uncharacterized protein LOC113336778 [Papaver somniferum]